MWDQLGVCSPCLQHVVNVGETFLPPSSDPPLLHEAWISVKRPNLSNVSCASARAVHQQGWPGAVGSSAVAQQHKTRKMFSVGSEDVLDHILYT